MKNIIITIALLIVANSTLFATNYYFTANADNSFENPANWTPAYPGNTIKTEDKVFVQADMIFNGFNLIVNGLLDVSLGVNVSSEENNLINNGSVINNGEIRVASVINNAKLDNSSIIWIQNIANKRMATVNNNMMGTITITKQATNEGTFTNAGVCVFYNNFANESLVNQLHNAKMEVKGNYTSSSNAELKKSATSTFASGNIETERASTEKATVKYADLLMATETGSTVNQ
jgi:hypothetical protein